MGQEAPKMSTEAARLVDEVMAPSQTDAIREILERVRRIEEWQQECNNLARAWAAKVGEFEQSPIGQMMMGQVEGILGG